MPRFLRGVRDRPARLVVVGGGVGGIEAALALRAQAGPLPEIDLISPEAAFVYRAMSVAEPFGFRAPPPVPFERLERDRNVRHRRDAVAAVDAARHVVVLRSGHRLAYRALVVAVGAHPRAWLDGAVTFDGPGAVGAMRELLARIEAGSVGDVLFAAPPDASWTLPLYELALLTSAWCSERRLPAPRLRIVTPEAEPLGIFGAAATRLVRQLLADRGIAIHSGATVERFDRGRAELTGGLSLETEAVVAVPRVTGAAVPGLPTDADGFIPVDDHGRVTGTADVYAVGDATTHPVKQGGLAAQQADVAAAAIARSLGVAVDTPAHRPVLRGMMLTGVTSAFLRSDGPASAAAFDALWWPPTKVAGRHLSAYLADMRSVGEPDELADREPAGDVDDAGRERAELRGLAAEMASADARWGDYASAARWLQTIEWLDGALPADLAARRDGWLAAAAARTPPRDP